MTKIYNRTKDLLKRRKLRNDSTGAERILWEYIRKQQIHGLKFRRQYSIKGFVLDFYCPKLRIAIEVDGGYHNNKDVSDYDAARQRLLSSLEIKFIRFTNDEIFNNINKVIAKIKEETQTSLPLSKGKMSRALLGTEGVKPKGFTLIELVITIVLLGIIAATGANFIYPILNTFFAVPVQVRGQQIGDFMADDCIEGSPSSEGFRIMKNIVSASDASINYLLANSTSITLTWSSTTKKLTKTDLSGSYVLPKEFSNNDMSLDGQTAGVIFKYYDSSGNIISSPVATPANIKRIEMDWIIYTGSANIRKMEAKYLLNTGVQIKQF